ncbi:hypothetical protein LUZ61_005932 [Rhynchospora tenuis]|uniref:Receptor-like serine/threonine-protein kinase n=1 Tax=Rhynchospora tenuis TaxID=198213 RepID=A0AAD5ZQG7_9POAL|nr:hypothetical protein LUZ61_005932 [Rhynchospora tenuis]
MAACLPVLAILLSFSFVVNPQPLYNSTAIAPISWINSPAILSANYSDYSSTRVLLLQLNPDGLGPSFAAGFYCNFFSSNSFSFSIFIVNANSTGIVAYSFPPRVIWTANQGYPVTENATLQLTSQSGLTLRDSDGSIIWTTDVGNRSVAGINITEYGNLVLFDKDNSSIWQSWEQPTDSLVIGQSLAGGQSLVAADFFDTSLTDRAYLTLLAGGLFAFVNSDPQQLYGHISLNSNMSVDNSTFMTFANGTLKMSSILHMPNESQVLINLEAAKGIQYMTLDYDGHLRIYEYNSTNDNWNMVRDLFGTEKCNYPASCGHYGICSIKMEKCICPQGYFTQVYDQRSNLGCSAITPITCEDANDHHWVTISDVSYFNYIDDTAFSIIDVESCKEACLRNCSCKAVVYYYYENSYNGRCFPLSEVFSFKKYKANSIESPNSYGSAYIKVQVAPSPSPSASPQLSSSRVGLGPILGSTFGALLLFLSLIIIYLVCLRRDEEEQEDFIEKLPGLPTRFSFEELQVATENFTKKLGEGGFGIVFEGSWANKRIAVKSLHNIGHVNKDFLMEVQTIGSIHHINLVRLTGFCADKLNGLLVYEYMCNGSLDKWIYCSEGRVPLDWPIRFKIITHIAKGLCYLHEECTQKIVHFDIKPENILLDEKFNAKVCDFGLSKLIDRDKSRVMTKMRGTPGYLAPEWLTAMVTEKVDVYSFGVVLVEILCGRRNLDYSQIEENCHLIALLEQKSKRNELLDLIDKNLGDVELYEEEIMNVMKLAMWCLQWDGNRRPSMSAVVKVLERAMEVDSSLDYNFISSIPMITNAASQVDESASLLTSSLSGPR